jgi:hypothetical protein
LRELLDQSTDSRYRTASATPIQISTKPRPLIKPRTKSCVKNSLTCGNLASSEFSVHIRVQGKTVRTMPTSRHNSTNTARAIRFPQSCHLPGRRGGGGINRIGPPCSGPTPSCGSCPKELIVCLRSGACSEDGFGSGKFVPLKKLGTAPCPPSQPYSRILRRRYRESGLPHSSTGNLALKRPRPRSPSVLSNLANLLGGHPGPQWPTGTTLLSRGW